MRLDLASLFSDHVNDLRPTGSNGQHIGLCPLHDDKVPSFSVNLDEGLWICHAGCGSGDAAEFAARLGVDPKRFYRNGNGEIVAPPRVSPERQAVRPLPRAEVEKARTYFTRLRDDWENLTKDLPWTKEAAKRVGVGYDADSGRIVFIHRDSHGQVVNVKHHKGKGGLPPYSISGHGQNRLYPGHLLPIYDEDFVIYCEGEKDVVTLLSHGFHAITGTTGAANVPPDLRPLSRFKAVVVVLDHDAAGRAGSIKTADSILAQCPNTEIFIGYWPEDKPSGYDITVFFQEGGTAEDFERLMLSDLYSYAKPTISGKSEAGIVSAPIGNEVWAEINLKFQTAREIGESTPEIPPWVVPGFLVRGGITELDGKIKAAGKTTFALHLCRSVLDGAQFLGAQTETSGVVYLTEQADSSFREALSRAGLLEREDMTVLAWHDAIGVSWSEIVDAAIAEAIKRGAGVLVVDTLGQWAGIRGDNENSAGEALQVLRPLQIAASVYGLAVLLIRHERKSGGEVGDSGRGSSAFAGGVDIILSLRRGAGNVNPSIRVIHALSRFSETPDTMTIELTDDGYINLGTETAVAEVQGRAAILDIIPGIEENAQKEKDLLEAAGVARSTGQRVLNQLRTEGLIVRKGNGKRNGPFLFWMPPEKVSAQTSSPLRAETNFKGDNSVKDGARA